MQPLHALFMEYFPKNAKVLNIGFGSGRDLAFLKRESFEVWGVDATEAFVLHVKQRFPEIAGHFHADRLPFSSFSMPSHFDAVTAIALWMHLDSAEYAASVRDIALTCKHEAVVIISFSPGSRPIDDERTFHEVDTPLLKRLFESYGFNLVHSESHADALTRKTLQWQTCVFRRKGCKSSNVLK